MFKCTLGPLGAIALLKIKTHTGTIINVDMGKGTLRAFVAHSAQKMRTRQIKNIGLILMSQLRTYRVRIGQLLVFDHKIDLKHGSNLG